MPYIIGVDKKYKNFIESEIDLSDKIVLDLDEDTLTSGIPELEEID